MSALVLAADRPERVASLVIVNGAARALWAPDYRSRLRQPSRADPFTTVAIEPGRGRAGFRRAEASSHPTVAATIAFRAWWDAAGNRAASPSMARAVEPRPWPIADVRDKLPHITAPTLVLHRRNVCVRPRRTRPVPRRAHRGVTLRRTARRGRAALGRRQHADRSTRSRSSSPAPAAARTPNVCSPQSSSPTSSGRPGAPPRSGDDRWHASARQSRQRRSPRARALPRTRESTRVGDGFVAIFTSPSVAIDCADAIVDAVRPLGIEVRSGHSRGRGRGARRRHRRHGGAHRCARSRRSRGRARCWCRRRCARSSPVRAGRSTNAASTSSKACPVVGACTPWYVEALP